MLGRGDHKAMARRKKTKWKGVTIYEPTYIHETVQIGEGTKIGAFCDIGRNVIIGRECNIQCHVSISNGCIIGNRVFIGPKATLLNDKYPPSPTLQPVVVRDEAVIGGGAIILPGVTIGERAVIGAGSVVTRDVPPNEVWYGNPARYHMRRWQYDAKRM